MKNLLFAGFMLLFAAGIFAQPNPDSVVYVQQRNKINAMLADRRAKFGQYDTSLTKRSGIFGMQTKGDVKRSNEILMDIAETDDEIFTELKKLFDYNNNQLKFSKFQRLQTENNLKDAEKSRIAYLNSISTLRQQNDSLKVKVKQLETAGQKKQGILIVVIVILFASILALLIVKRKTKA
ncbi:hypothetical protein FPZ42_10590 [Mucilaginibacter achroorhodeus]|uniref:Uncharacterized protein n=1 Tax=Mucilaginibacter achroorhodeus TaxID=2599294 RepID=A0A563U403_9SPHI|nr:hypothetical protein [Mucilaginibacter achroorhodeus]TWR26070.1 hypothetical protein FPZ42_10590 [Mucilaginibacter achroorhodeus]